MCPVERERREGRETGKEGGKTLGESWEEHTGAICGPMVVMVLQEGAFFLSLLFIAACRTSGLRPEHR